MWNGPSGLLAMIGSLRVTVTESADFFNKQEFSHGVTVDLLAKEGLPASVGGGLGPSRETAHCDSGFGEFQVRHGFLEVTGSSKEPQASASSTWKTTAASVSRS